MSAPNLAFEFTKGVAATVAGEVVFAGVAKYAEKGLAKSVTNEVTTAGNSEIVGKEAKVVDGLTKANPSVCEAEKVAKGAGDASNASNNEEFKSTFAKNIDGSLNKQKITLDKFNSLRLKDVSTLNDTEKSTLKAVRESIPMPDQNTVMQKVIPAGDIQKYLDGTYTQVGGYVAKAEDVSHLKTYEDIQKSLRLDYPNSAFKPKAGSLGIIRFKTPDSSQMGIPYSPEMGGTTKAAQPFTGNEFIKSTNGQIIPEFKANKRMRFFDGAELYEIGRNGAEKLVAIYSRIDGKFIEVK